MKDDNFLRANNAQHMWHPMGHPGEAMEHTPTIIETASGSTIKDIDGHETIDAVGGLWCVNLGYSNDVVKDAIAKQLYDLPYYSAFAGTSNPSAIEASYAVREFFAEDGMARVFFDLWRIGFGRNLFAPGPSVSSDQRRTEPHEIPESQKRLSRHPLWWRVGQWQQSFPHQLRTAFAGLFPHAQPLHLSQPV